MHWPPRTHAVVEFSITLSPTLEHSNDTSAIDQETPASSCRLSDALSLPRWYGKQVASGQTT